MSRPTSFCEAPEVAVSAACPRAKVTVSHPMLPADTGIMLQVIVGAYADAEGGNFCRSLCADESNRFGRGGLAKRTRYGG